MSRRQRRRSGVELSFDEYVDRYESSPTPQRPERHHNPYNEAKKQLVRLERMRREHLASEVEDLDEMQYICHRLKRAMRRSSSKMNDLHRRMKKKYWKRLLELKKLDKRQKRLEMERRANALRSVRPQSPMYDSMEKTNFDRSGHKHDKNIDSDNESTDSDCSIGNEGNNNLLKPLNEYNYQLLVSLGIMSPKSNAVKDNNNSARVAEPTANTGVSPLPSNWANEPTQD